MMDIATALAVRSAIDHQLDDLICAARRNVAALKGVEMRENQIRNVVNVAATTDSMEAVTNFIRYQIGRDPRRWGDFGKAVIADIETGALKMAVDGVLQDVPGADPIQVRAELTRLYMGYLNRHFVYADKSGDWQSMSA